MNTNRIDTVYDILSASMGNEGLIIIPPPNIVLNASRLQMLPLP